MLFLKSFSVVILLVFSTSTAASDGVVMGQGYFVPHTITPQAADSSGKTFPATVSKFTFVKQGESCIAAFKRLGEKVAAAECILAVQQKNTNINVAWYRPYLDKPATYIVILHKGDKVGVFEENGTKTYVVFPK
jgi:hypothetical protein